MPEPGKNRTLQVLSTVYKRSPDELSSLHRKRNTNDVGTWCSATSCRWVLLSHLHNMGNAFKKISVCKSIPPGAVFRYLGKCQQVEGSNALLQQRSMLRCGRQPTSKSTPTSFDASFCHTLRVTTSHRAPSWLNIKPCLLIYFGPSWNHQAMRMS